MRTILLALVASVAVLVPVVPSAPASAGGTGYVVYIGCSSRPGAPPASECRLSQTPTAFFRSKRHDATYRVCVKFPDKKRRLCAGAQSAPEDQLRPVAIATSVTGRHVVTWYVAGQVVGRRSFRVTEG